MSNRLPFVRLSSLHSLIININIGRFFIIFCVVLIVVQISYPRLSICLPFCCLDSLVLYERLDELTNWCCSLHPSGLPIGGKEVTAPVPNRSCCFFFRAFVPKLYSKVLPIYLCMRLIVRADCGFSVRFQWIHSDLYVLSRPFGTFSIFLGTKVTEKNKTNIYDESAFSRFRF